MGIRRERSTMNRRKFLLGAVGAVGVAVLPVPSAAFTAPRVPLVDLADTTWRGILPSDFTGEIGRYDSFNYITSP